MDTPFLERARRILLQTALRRTTLHPRKKASYSKTPASRVSVKVQCKAVRVADDCAPVGSLFVWILRSVRHSRNEPRSPWRDYVSSFLRYALTEEWNVWHSGWLSPISPGDEAARGYYGRTRGPARG